MATTVWKGHLTFGLVSVPVRLLRAARAERVSLRQLYRPAKPSMVFEPPPAASEPQSDSGARRQPERRDPEPLPELPAPEPEVAPVRRTYQSADAGEDTPIASSELVKGYEYEKGQYVVVDEQDFRSIAPQTSTEMQIVEFVRFNEIDPVYLETSYYLVPDGPAEKPYALLLEAMRKTGYAAIGDLTMHRRDNVVIVRPGKTGLIAHTMYYPDEVRSIQEFRTDTGLVAPKELSLATSLIEALAQPFDPTQFKNNFRERLEQLIDSRIEGKQVAHAVTRTAAATKVVDIMEALKRSLAEAKATRKPVAGEQLPSKRKAARGR